MSLSPRRWIRRALLHMLPRRLLIEKGDRASSKAYLTFDDGPHPELTPRLLDRLAELDVRATFFVVGRQAERHPDIVARIYQAGHALGSHSWNHAEPRLTSARTLVEETLRTRTLIEQITGVRTPLMRPPYGAVSPGKLCRLWSQQQTVVLWSLDPRDYTCGSSEQLEQRLQTAPPSGGDIILLHDDRPAALGAMRYLTEFCTARRLSLETLERLFPSCQSPTAQGARR